MFSRREVILAITLFVAFALPLFTLACSFPPAESLVALDCLDADDIVAMRAEWNADSEATEAKYVGKEVCVQGDIVSIWELETSIAVGSRVGGISIGISHIKDPDPTRTWRGVEPDIERARAKELKKWLKGKEIGDPLVANCPIEGFEDSEDSNNEVGTPEFGFYCKLVER